MRVKVLELNLFYLGFDGIVMDIGVEKEIVEPCSNSKWDSCINCRTHILRKGMNLSSHSYGLNSILMESVLPWLESRLWQWKQYEESNGKIQENYISEENMSLHNFLFLSDNKLKESMGNQEQDLDGKRIYCFDVNDILLLIASQIYLGGKWRNVK